MTYLIQHPNLSVQKLQRVIFVVGACLITFMHFFNTKTNVSAEPGVAMSVYSAYNAVIRLDGDEKVIPIPNVQYRSYLDGEVEASEIWKQECAKTLANDSSNCYLTNVIEDDSKIKHFKSYSLPTTLAGITFDKETTVLLQSQSISLTPKEPSKKTYAELFQSGIMFFNILLWIKVGIFYILCFKFTRVITSRIFFLIFAIHSSFSIIMDKIFSRGSGTYPIDKVIFGSPTFRNGTSLMDASISAIFDVTKAMIGPGPGTVLWGITPRSVVVFIALAIFLPIFLERNWQLIWLTPIGFGVHFTTFAVLYLFLFTIALMSGCLPSRRDLAAIVWSVVITLLYSIFQLPTRLFSYWLVFLASLMLLCICFFKSSQNVHTTETIGITVPLLKRVLVTTITIFYLVAISSISFYALKFGVPESKGYWIDGFTREIVGRLSPLVTSLSLGFLIVVWSQNYLPVSKFLYTQILYRQQDRLPRSSGLILSAVFSSFFAVIYIGTQSLFI